jgi:hypothetical protein
MIALRCLSAPSRRIGIGLAVAALAMTSFAAPLSAFAHEAAQATTVMAIGQPGDTPPPTQTPATAPKKADIKVVARGKTQTGNTTKYHFVIRNLGPSASGNFNAYKEAQLNNGSDYQMTDNMYFPLNLASGQEKMVTVTCVAPAGYTCTTGIALSVNNGTDPDNSNNIAVLN